MSMYPPLKATFLRKPGSGVLKNKSVQANGQINEKNIYQKKNRLKNLTQGLCYKVYSERLCISKWCWIIKKDDIVKADIFIPNRITLTGFKKIIFKHVLHICSINLQICFWNVKFANHQSPQIKNVSRLSCFYKDICLNNSILQ